MHIKASCLKKWLLLKNWGNGKSNSSTGATAYSSLHSNTDLCCNEFLSSVGL